MRKFKGKVIFKDMSGDPYEVTIIKSFLENDEWFFECKIDNEIYWIPVRSIEWIKPKHGKVVKFNKKIALAEKSNHPKRDES